MKAFSLSIKELHKICPKTALQLRDKLKVAAPTKTLRSVASGAPYLSVAYAYNVNATGIETISPENIIVKTITCGRLRQTIASLGGLSNMQSFIHSQLPIK